MSEKGRKILETFGRALPGLSDLEKEKLLAFGEGMAFMVDQRKSGTQGTEPRTSGKETA